MPHCALYNKIFQSQRGHSFIRNFLWSQGSKHLISYLDWVIFFPKDQQKAIKITQTLYMLAGQLRHKGKPSCISTKDGSDGGELPEPGPGNHSLA